MAASRLEWDALADASTQLHRVRCHSQAGSLKAVLKRGEELCSSSGNLSLAGVLGT